MESAQADLAEIGIDITIRTVDNATNSALIGTGDYDMMCGMASYSSNATSMKSGQLSTSAWNQSQYRSAELDEQIMDIGATTDEEARAEKIESFIAAFNDLALRLGLYQKMNVRAYDSDLDGVEVNVQGYEQFAQLCWK